MRNDYSQLLVKHGIVMMIAAMLAGFLLIFSMIGMISFSPFPLFIQSEIPGSPQGWRAVHVGAMMNGIMAVALGTAMRQLAITSRGSAVVAWGTIIAIWGNLCFYLFGMFAPNHGVTLQSNSLGEANLAGAIAFIPACAGVVTLLVALIAMLRAKPVE